MDEEFLHDIYDLDNDLELGNINANEDVNIKANEYMKNVKRYINEKKLKSCEIFLTELLNDFENEPFEFIIFSTIKIYCNLRLYNYRSISNDLTSLGNLECSSYRFENYSDKYKKKKGTMIPFLLRLINCYYPYTLSLYFTSFDRLYLLILNYEEKLKKCIEYISIYEKKDEKNEHIEINISSSSDISNNINFYRRKKNIIFHYICITSYVLCDLLLKKNYIEQAIQLLRNKILYYDQNDINTISLIGKLSLLMGCLDISVECFNKVESFICSDNYENINDKYQKNNGDDINNNNNNNNNNKNNWKHILYNHSYINKNFLNLYLEEYNVALNELFKISPDFFNKNAINDYSFYSNNLSITYFYNNDLKNAIHILETLINENYINTFPSLVKNLNYFYELAKIKNEQVNTINDFISNNLGEDQEILSVIPRRT
ncbi:conserved Plasmodium protein, unknown function [Plasmodium sp. gorilla clade G2]|uniref:conserved Plasmodium protein, unknown function n=1 Tax=Plasmodium sp. gorilla clade G2 TaxID=880535 RepID=UPI000D20C710|nr:conserved Plasmodium protein, unknown function [Plasmodium sp. gorilla clade G2]SOV17009.1 conserved Plasmodium protein, unknown function [Plasmodium sp. gorilla clade G2]